MNIWKKGSNSRKSNLELSLRKKYKNPEYNYVKLEIHVVSQIN